MTVAGSFELAQFGALREMLESPGPCITILLPPYRPGEPSGSPAAILRLNIQEASRLLAEEGVSRSESGHLLEPLAGLIKDAALARGANSARAVLRSPTIFDQFVLTQPVEPCLRVGGCFALRKLARELARPRVFYVLAVSKEGASLQRCRGLQTEAVRLPAGVPDRLVEAMDFDAPEHDLENRSAAGVSTGSMRRVRFGTGSGRERQHTHLADYYKLVDRRLQEVLEAEIPLILAGVHEDTALYRAVSAYPALASSSLTGSLDIVDGPAEILRQAYSILEADARKSHRATLAVAMERMNPSRISTDLGAILQAAFDGRVAQLYLDQDAERMDVFEPRAYRSWGKEDLLNLAAVQTTIRHGMSYELPRAEMMPEGAVAVGLMRY